MPRRDGTGPTGQGANTGRGAGPCTPKKGSGTKRASGIASGLARAFRNGRGNKSGLGNGSGNGRGFRGNN